MKRSSTSASLWTVTAATAGRGEIFVLSQGSGMVWNDLVLWVPPSFAMSWTPRGTSPYFEMISGLVSVLGSIFKIWLSCEMALLHLAIREWLNPQHPGRWMGSSRPAWVANQKPWLNTLRLFFFKSWYKGTSLLYHTNDFGRTWRANTRNYAFHPTRVLGEIN